MKYLAFMIAVIFLWHTIAPSYAGMVSTAEMATQQKRAKLFDLLQRDEIRQELEQKGVDYSFALSRVSNMTNQEIAALHGSIENLPAGGKSDEREWSTFKTIAWWIWFFVFWLWFLGLFF